MASLNSQHLISIISLTLFLFISFPSRTLSQTPSFTPTPTVTTCASRLLPLTPCAPFVQGMARLPSQSCCDNLKLLYSEKPDCLCAFLNNNMSSLPINSTLALQLPAFCSIPVNLSACSGVPQKPPSSTASQLARGAHKRKGQPSNATVSASPMFQIDGPIPSVVRSSPAVKSKKEQSLVFLMTLTASFSILAYTVGL